MLANSLRFGALTSILLFGVSFATAEETATSDTAGSSQWAAIPSGIADKAGKIAYVTGVSDGVDAIDMANGRSLWESKAARKPVALAGDRVIAIAPHAPTEKANVLNVVVLDANNGNILSHTQPIVFPDWIAVDGGIGLGFSSTVAVEGNTLKLYWHAWRQFVGGVPPTQDAISAARKDDTGVASVNLETGHVDVRLEEIPKSAKKTGLGKFTDVGDVRLIVSERQEKVPGGVQLIRRTLEASNKATGRPLWHHEIASDLIVPNTIPQQAQAEINQQQSQQQQRR